MVKLFLLAPMLPKWNTAASWSPSQQLPSTKLSTKVWPTRQENHFVDYISQQDYTSQQALLTVRTEPAAE